MKIAIIGAGLSGANIYNLLKKDGHSVTIFDKSRGAGGRCSTRYINDKLIDHGTPFFEASNKEFTEFCDQQVQNNILVKKENNYYPINGINKLCSSLINSEDFIKNTKIISCKFKEKKWSLKDENSISYEDFDTLIVTIPTQQILSLDIDLNDEIKQSLRTVTYDSIATLMVYSYTNINIMNPTLLADTSFKKVVDNSSKYNYQNFSSYVIHLNQELTNKQNFTNKEEVKAFMLQNIFSISGIDLEDDFHIMSHFWKYAFVTNSLDEEYIYDKNFSLGICGDFFNGTNLEGAYLSSKRLYETIVKS
jgi:hypothetical protein